MNWSEHLRDFGVEPSPKLLDAFQTFRTELIRANAHVNLTAITDPHAIELKHFLDSLSLTPYIRTAHKVIDVGSGAGFPGIPLKLALPQLKVVLLEATRKKVSFLVHIIATLGIDQISAIHSRAEDLGHDPIHREKYDAVVARAVADLTTLSEYALPFTRVGGIFISQKGTSVEDETRRAERSIDTLGGRLREIVPVQLPGLETRHLIVIEKISATPHKYPRPAGVPVRKPLR